MTTAGGPYGASEKRPYRHPPSGTDWVSFGTHAVPVECAGEPLEFAGTGEDGLPLWERHDDCRVVLGTCDKCSATDVPVERPEGEAGEHLWFCLDCLNPALAPPQEIW